jgi:hypothetical protein
MSQAAIIGILGLMMVCCSSSSVAAFMMGGDDDSSSGSGSTGSTGSTDPTTPADSTTPVDPPDPPDPSRKCKRTVTARRTDAPNNGWGMPLEFKCGEQTVTIGNSSTNSKTVGPYSLAAGACPASIDKNNWLGGHTWPDTFDIRLSECLDENTCKRKVTARRTDAPNNGWGMPLEFKCGEQTVTIGNSSTNSKTTAQPVNISQVACPPTIDKNNWLGGHTWPDTFKIDVSDCV